MSDHARMEDGHRKPESVWRRAIRTWNRTQPRPRSELRELLERLDGQHVELQPYADKLGHVEWWAGTLDATQIGRGVVEFTYATGERKTVMLSAIGYVIVR